jgi:hypothetical protein
MKKNILLGIIMMLILPLQAQVIKQKTVSKIIKKLASDKMNGRQAGTSDAKKAAEFIASKFKKSGLSYYTGLQSYEQTFEMYSIKKKSQNLKINDKKIKESDYFVFSNAKTFTENDLTKFTVSHIKKDDDFRKGYGEARQTTKNQLVLIDPSHKATFERYHHYFSKPVTTFKVEEDKPVLIYLLSEEDEVSKFDFQHENTTEKQTFRNVVGVLEGKSKKDEIILFSAHFDHLGVMENDKEDKIANGADDDASGVTAVISLADYFSKKGTNERTLVFVAFTAEEIGGFGSKYFSEKMNPEKVIAGVNIEMIGKASKFGAKQAFITGFDKSDFGTILQKNVEGKAFGFHPDPYPKQNLFYRSDNATLARLGVPAHSVSSDQIDKDPYYHTVDDEIETLDMEHLTQMIQAIAEGVQTLISGEDTPTRIAKEGKE